MRKLENSGELISIESRMGAPRECLQETDGLGAGYLFGSYGTSEQTPLSDVDLAFVFRPDSVPTGSVEVEFRNQVLRAVEQEDVSITILNRAPSPFQFKVLTTGRLLYQYDPVALADFVEGVLNIHCDFTVDYEAFLREYDVALGEQYSEAETHKPDPDKIRQKVQLLRDALRQLDGLRERGEAELSADPILQAAAIRYLQVGIEAVLDTANHIIAREGFGLPKTYQESIDLLIQESILPAEKAGDFAAMVDFRNRAVHLYQRIEPAEVWKILEEDLEDFEFFIRAMVERYL